LIALKHLAQCPAQVGPYEVGFQLAPRLNAAGRLETAATALALLRAPDAASALPLAEALDAQNRERQNIERAITEEVLGTVRARFNPQTDYVIVEGCSAWHIGVVGIVASRLVQEFWRPALLVGGDGEVWRGSGRSIPGFDLAAALRACGELLVRHGGHAMAAGLSVRPENLDALRARLNELARAALRPEDLQPPLRLDAEVGLDELTVARVQELERIRPTGAGNPGVQLCARRLRHQRPLQRIGRERQHVKLWVTDGAGTHPALWWRAGEEALPVGVFDLAFVPEINDYNGRRSVQLRVLDWRAAD
jgi:single-stranded-DNA-specific exonuclease